MYTASYSINVFQLLIVSIIYLIRSTTDDELAVSITNHEKLIILLVDQYISNRTLSQCSDISTNTNINIISFGHNLLNDLNIQPEVHTSAYVVHDLKSAVEAVMSYLK